MSTKFYLAYGSNLHIAQMRRRCPTSNAVGTAWLTGYRLLYRGSKTGAYLTVEPSPSDSVPVGVWSVTDEDEESLDFYEGYPAFYTKETVSVIVTPLNGRKRTPRRVEAFFYAMPTNHPLGIPSPRYVQTCTVGYQCFGFDTRYLQHALADTRGEMLYEKANT